MNRKNKWSICLFILALLIVGSTGCAKKAQKEAVERKEISIWHYWDQSSAQRALRDIVYSFNESQNEYKLTVRYVPDADFKKELALAIADNEAPELALIDMSDLRYFDDMKQFEDLSPVMEQWDQYYEPLRDICELDTRIAAMPFGINLLAMYYNVDAVNGAGVDIPKTMDEMVDAAKALTTSTRYGFAMSAIQSEESSYNFLPFLWGTDGDIDDLNSENGKKSFELIQTMTEQGSMSRQCINLTMNDVARQFAEGNVAMMFNTSMTTNAIRDINQDLNFDVTYLPMNSGTKTVLGGELLTVLDSEAKEGALAFVKYVADPERMRGYMDGFGMLAPRTDVAENQYEKDGVQKFFVDYLPYAESRELTPDWPRISLEITDAISETIIGEVDLNDILAETADNIREIREDQE